MGKKPKASRAGRRGRITGNNRTSGGICGLIILAALAIPIGLGLGVTIVF